MEKVSSGIVTSNEVYQAITILMLLCSVGFRIRLQILQRIVKFSADCNSQRKAARMLEVSQGCISKVLRRNQETGRPHQPCVRPR